MAAGHGSRLSSAVLAEALADDAVADKSLHDEVLADVWDSWTRRWDAEFQRLDGLEEQRRAAAALRGCREAHLEAQRAGLEAAAAVSRQHEDALEEVEQEALQEQLRAGGKHARAEAAADALRSADDMVRQISENAARRRQEAEARRRKAREAAREAEQRRWREAAAPPRPSDASAGSTAPPPQSQKPPLRPSSLPVRRVVGAAAVAPPTEFKSFADFEFHWAQWERRAGAASDLAEASLGCADIPWPTSLPTVSGVAASDDAAVRKQKLRAALVRWHPDKWGGLMACVRPAERPLVVERVKEVTRRIIAERQRYGA